jgi:hypothetical protein
MTGGYGNRLSFWRYNGNGVNAGPAMDIFDNGNVSINNGNLDVSGQLTVNSIRIKGTGGQPDYILEVNASNLGGLQVSRANDGRTNATINVGRACTNARCY